jgi:AcrR family transcriptional regulator
MGDRPLVNDRRRRPVPTGLALSDPRDQLFDAAERVLLRDGPSGLSSRAVTSEAGCAKGVLHRHFADFDTFLAELVRDRITRIGDQGDALCDAAGTGTVAGNLAGALTVLFDSVALEIVGLVTSRHQLLDTLRQTTTTGIPVLTEAAAMVASYLRAEQDLGRITREADVDALAPTLIGAAHLQFAGRRGTPLPPAQVHAVVTTVIPAG